MRNEKNMLELLQKYITKKIDIIELKIQLSEIKNINDALPAIKFQAKRGMVAYSNCTALEVAVSIQNILLMKALLDVGADIDLGIYKPILIAAQNLPVTYGTDINFIILKELLSDTYKANINIRREGTGENIFFVAISKNRMDIIEFLLAKHIDINIPGPYNFPPIFMAARLGHHPIVERLCQLGADLTPKTSPNNILSNGNTANLIDLFMPAIQENHINVISVLLKYIKPLNECWNFLIYSERNKILELLLKNNSDSNIILNPNILITTFNAEKKYKKIRPIQAAVAEGYGEKVKLLLNYGADPNMLCLDGCTTLYYAAINNRTKILQILIGSGKIKNIDKLNEEKNNIDYTALSIAMYSGHFESTQLLLKYGAKPDIKDITENYPINYIFQNKHLKLISLFNSYLNQHYLYKNLLTRSIHIAITNGDIDLLRCLQKNGADVNYREGDFLSPLSQAIIYQVILKKPEIINALLKFGAHPNGNTTEPIPPIFAAIEANNPEVIRLLITDPKFNIQDTLALIRAIEYGHLDCVKMIITYIDPLTLGYSVSPLFHAIYLNREEAVNMIIASLKMENRINDLELHIKICLTLLPLLIDDEILLNQITLKLDQILKSDLNAPTQFSKELDSKKHEQDKENWSPHFFNSNSTSNPNDTSISTAFTSTTIISHSSHHYLLKEHGWTSEKIKSAKSELKQNLIKRKKTDLSSASNLASQKIYTWFEGNLNSSTLFSVENSRSQENNFLWLPEKEILEQGCSDELFKKFNNKSRYTFSEDNIKNLNNLKIIEPFKLYGKIYYLSISHELKIPKSESRILLFPILSDDLSATLYLGGKFLSSGLHKKSDCQKLSKPSFSGKVYEINPPVLEAKTTAKIEKIETAEKNHEVSTYRSF